METLRYVVLVNGLLVVVSLGYYILLRRETLFDLNRLVLWLSLTAAIILPLLELPDWRPQPIRMAMQRTAQVIVPTVLPNSTSLQPEVTSTLPHKKTYRAFPLQQKWFTWSWQKGFILLYMVGVFTLLIRFGLQLVSLQKLIRQSVHELYDGFTLARNESVTSPFSFFSWVVLNPDHHTPDELEQILRHERVHVRKWHSLDMISAELLCIVFWFNPAAYVFRYVLQQALEFQADHGVLTEGVDAKTYQYNLLKVSLSAEPSTLTNQFSKSQLKSRIAMLNRQESSKISWLKYPIFITATLTVASVFARPKDVKILSKYVSKPIVETIADALISPNQSFQSTVEVKPVVIPKLVGSATDQSSLQKLAVQQVNSQLDSLNKLTKSDNVRLSPSCYMIYQGDYLYWVITPKMKLEDFMAIKLELAKHGCQLQLNEIKYDPLYAYIERIDLSVVGPNGVHASVNEPIDDNKPIPANAAYMVLNRNSSKDHEVWASRISGRFGKTFPLYQNAGEENFPDLLREVADSDEAAISQFITNKKMDYLLLAGERKYGHLGIGFRKFNQKEIKKQSKHGGFIDVNPDGSLSINEGPSPWIIKAFINNESATSEEVRKLKINQLYTLAIILGYDNTAQKRSGTDYLFFYVNEAN